MFSLEGKKALVTGASGGIGAAIATTLHRQGAEVVISGTRESVLGELADQLGSRVHVVTANLSDRESTDALAKSAEEAMGGVDILVNNAGLTRDGLFMRMKDEDWDTVLEVNLTSGMRLIRALLRGMMKRRYGRIVGITSVVGITGNPGQGNYAASKAGMIGMYKALAQEVATRGITANTIAPGFIRTAMTGALDDKQHDAILGAIPKGEMGTPDDIASAAAFLSSAESGYITGQTLHVNGGMAMI